MITALISAITGLLSAGVPELLKEWKDTRAHTREVEFLELNQKLALERAKHEADVKIEDNRTAQTVAEIQANEKNFEALMRQAMTPVGIGWIDGLNAVVRPLTAVVFMGLFAVGVIVWMFGVGAHDAGFGAAMGSIYVEGVEATLGFMFGSRAVASRLPKAA